MDWIAHFLFHATNANDVNLQNFISKKKREKQKKGIEGRETRENEASFLMVHKSSINKWEIFKKIKI
jgi:hypothetical protein